MATVIQQAPITNQSSSTSTTAPITTSASSSSNPAASLQRYTRWQMFRSRLANVSMMGRPHAQQPHHARQSTLPEPDWISGWLHPISLAAFFIVSLSACIGLATLIAESHVHLGIATISSDSSGRTIAGIQVGRGLLWTFIPTLLVQIYSLWFKAIASAFKERQPYVELREAGLNGVAASKSVLLDYSKEPAPITVISAIRKRHTLIAIVCLLSLFLALIATPAASHIFITQGNVQVTRSTSLTEQAFYDENGINGTTNLKSVLDYVTGIALYNASNPQWTKNGYSFSPLESKSLGSTEANISVVVNATQFLPKCEVLEDGIESSIGVEKNVWTVSSNDGICNNTYFFPRNGDYLYYSQTFNKIDCPLVSGSSPSRIFLFYAQVNEQKITTTKALISCTSEYINATGRLNISLAAVPSIRSFEYQSSVQVYPRPVFWQIFEGDVANIITSADTTIYSTTDLGRLVLDYVRTSSGNSASTNSSLTPLRPSDLATSLQVILEMLYAVAAQSYLYPMVPNEADKAVIPATYVTYLNRLVVVESIAGLLLAGFLCAIFTLLAIFWNTLSHTSILREECKGILSNTILTYNSTDLLQVSSDLRGRCQDGKCRDEYKRKPDPQKGIDNMYKDWNWKVEHADSFKDMQIVAVKPSPRPVPVLASTSTSTTISVQAPAAPPAAPPAAAPTAPPTAPPQTVTPASAIGP